MQSLSAPFAADSASGADPRNDFGRLADSFDWKNPDYGAIARLRAAKLLWLREKPQRMADLTAYYRDGHYDDFINDWGTTFSPWNVARNLPAKIPFLLFPKQRELIQWAVARWRGREPGLCDKSRETGVSWIMCSLQATLCIFHQGFVGGFGSRKLELVDKTGSPDSLFWKVREFIGGLPREFRQGWNRANDASGRISFGNGSVILGEGGDNIGRGGRTSLYVVDEAAYIEHPDLVDAALSANTTCRIDVSSAHGMGNSFAKRRHEWPNQGYGHRVFTFHWRDDPRKDEEWYQNECSKWDPIVIAQEHDINYTASVEGILIPNAWVQAAVDAHVALDMPEIAYGAARAGYDVADEGPDKNAAIVARGTLITRTEAWSGKDSDIYQSLLRMFRICDEEGITELTYDGDGMGAGVRGDAARINSDRATSGRTEVSVDAFHGAPILFPEREDIPGLKNKDKFASGAAQAWWNVRTLFENTWKARQAKKEGRTIEYQPDELISLDGQMQDLAELIRELAQVQYGYSLTNRLQVIKTPPGMASPNRADALKILLGRKGAIRQPSVMAERDLLVPNIAEPLAMPEQCDAVYASIVVSTKARDRAGAAVVYFAMDELPGAPLVIIDWDLVEIDSGLASGWLYHVDSMLEVYARATRARAGSAGLWLRDETAGAVLLNRAEQSGILVHKIPVREGAETDQEVKADALSRALGVAALMKEHAVRISQAAYVLKKPFKGLIQNHLLEQIRSVNTDTELDSLPLLNSFTHGVLLGREAF